MCENTKRMPFVFSHTLDPTPDIPILPENSIDSHLLT